MGDSRTAAAGRREDPGALEDLARDLGYDGLRLATGVRQPEAIALYEASGFTSVPPYGKYVGDPLSRCYQKPLGV